MPACRLSALLCLIPLLGAASARPQARPPVRPPARIVSLNMCADQLLIALADPGQIAALTEWARDPGLSYYADRAQALPFTHRTAEEVFALKPDLIVGAPFRTRAVLARLKGQGVAMLDLPARDGFDGIVASVRAIAGATGHPDRGERLIAAMRRDLAAIGAPPGRGRVAAYYQRGGYLTGTGTLVDEAFRRAGLVNLSRRIGKPALSALSLEELALARPDFVVMDSGTRRVRDRGTAQLHHPLLERAVPASHRLYIPQALTVCGGPGYPKAVALLAAQVRAADHATR